MIDQREPSWRFLNRDGTFNIERVERSRTARLKDVYHALLKLSWPRFLAAVGAMYFGANFAFAIFYDLLGPGALVRVGQAARVPGWRHFFDCFVFSVETLSSLGYSTIVPKTVPALALMSAESYVTLLTLALTTGLVFARFARPTARVLFSQVAVIGEQDGIPCFMFRLANLRGNQIVEAQISVNLTRSEVTAEGDRYRTFTDLKLERSRNPIFVLSWTVIHPIDQSSPLHGLTLEDLKKQQAEFIVVLTGWDETLAQTIHARFSYVPDEVLWDAGYSDMVSVDAKSRKLILNLKKIHETGQRKDKV